MNCDEMFLERCVMVKSTYINYSVIVAIFLAMISLNVRAKDSFGQQEQILEEQLAVATSSEQIAKITFALSNIKKQQSNLEFKKLPEMMGRDRSFLSASVRDPLMYRQMASTFKSEPARTSISYSYKIGNFLAICCVILGFIVLTLRSRYRY